MFRRRALRLSQVSPQRFNATDRRWPTSYPVSVTNIPPTPRIPRSLTRQVITLRVRWQQTNDRIVYPQPTVLKVHVLNDWPFPEDQIDTEHPLPYIRRNISGLIVPDDPVSPDDATGRYPYRYIEVLAYENRTSGEIEQWNHGRIYPIELTEAETTIVTPHPVMSETTTPD